MNWLEHRIRTYISIHSCRYIGSISSPSNSICEQCVYLLCLYAVLIHSFIRLDLIFGGFAIINEITKEDAIVMPLHLRALTTLSANRSFRFDLISSCGIASSVAFLLSNKIFTNGMKIERALRLVPFECTAIRR